jgi:hypothetical protein
MHPALTASSENSLRSAFAQFPATSSENKEYYLGIRPYQCVRDSDRLRSGAMVDSLERKRAGTGLMPKKKASSIPPKLTEAEHDLLAHMEHGYQLETDSLGGNPILRRLKDDEVVRPLSANRNTIKALEERPHSLRQRS